MLCCDVEIEIVEDAMRKQYKKKTICTHTLKIRILYVCKKTN